MSEFLFHVQWWIPTLLVLIGIILFVNGNKVQVARLRNSGAAIVVLALVWGLVSYLVDTDQEKVENGAREALQAVVDQKWDQFQGKLTPTAEFTVGSQSMTGAPTVTAIARNGAEMAKLKSAHIQNLTMEQAGTLIKADFDIFSTQDAYQPIEISSWEFDWELTKDGWRIREIKLLKLKDVGSLDNVIPQGIFK